jgi:hypothetical protein
VALGIRSEWRLVIALNGACDLAPSRPGAAGVPGCAAGALAHMRNGAKPTGRAMRKMKTQILAWQATVQARLQTCAFKGSGVERE